MAKAKIANPGIFGDIQMAPVAYRFDNRSPRMVFDQGAFSPNPLKPRGTIEAHTLKQSKGTGSYVSCSLDSVPSFLDLAVERPPYPNFIGRRQEFKRESGSSNWSPSNPIHLITDEFTGDTEWEDMRKKEFRTNSMGGRGDGTAPEWLAWQFWEYRLQNVEGVPILGGNHAWEREFVTRGIILDDFYTG